MLVCLPIGMSEDFIPWIIVGAPWMEMSISSMLQNEWPVENERKGLWVVE